MNFINNYPFIEVILSIFIFFLILLSSFNVSLKVNISKDVSINFISSSILTVVYLSISLFILLLLGIEIKIIKNLLIIYFLINFIIFFKKKKFFQFYKFEKKYLLILFIFFLISLLPPMDSDSLDYHLAGPKFILENNGFKKPIDFFWLHFRLVNLGEMISLLGLIFNTKFLGQILQFYSLIIIIFSYKLLKISIDKFNYLLFVLSIPLLVSLISSHKPTLYQSSIILFLSIIIIINYKNKFISQNSILISSLLGYCVASKISYLIVCLPIIGIVLYNYFVNRQFNQILIFILIFILINLIIFIKNYLVFNDPLTPFFHFNKLENLEYFNTWKNFLITGEYNTKNNSFFFNMVNLIIPINNIHNITQILGFGFLSFACLLNKASINNIIKNKNLIFILISILFVFFTFYFLGKGRPRFYLDIYLLLIVFLMLNYKYLNTKILNLLKLFLKFQITMIMSGLLLVIYYYFPANFSKKNYNEIMEKRSDGFLVSKWINEKVSKGENVLIENIRPRFFLNNEMISFINNTIDVNFVKNNQISYIVLNKTIENYITSQKCFELKDELIYSKYSKNFIKEPTKEKFYIYKKISCN